MLQAYADKEIEDVRRWLVNEHASGTLEDSEE
jgi:hypothetical protein